MPKVSSSYICLAMKLTNLLLKRQKILSAGVSKNVSTSKKTKR